MSAAGIALQLGATRQGNNWRCACPRDCGYSLSLSDGEDGRLLAFCFGGCEFNEIMLALVAHGLLDDDDGAGDDPHVSRRVAVCQADPKRIAHARQIYDGGVRDARIQIYLRSRRIGLTSPILKFQEQAPHRLGVRLPAMLAPVVNVTGEQIGVHLTYLRRDGGGKATLPKEYQRECRGVIHGGAIRLAEHRSGCGARRRGRRRKHVQRNAALWPGRLGGGLCRRTEDHGTTAGRAPHHYRRGQRCERCWAAQRLGRTRPMDRRGALGADQDTA